ncbi:hypothetical protein NEHOM01_0994 [Nematocida homosporus]|uniref:uncharacterized protein n=1 Tax=Nematocida homosporus TaxID=1912981 RepID=UPI00221FD0C8|nr:uncharacterized protein NEHOM01_0994 [Nematocida homosporus]KAI5185702.1 hypothetical protein NEHOM01_0994 [Nematocida homosporus]
MGDLEREEVYRIIAREAGCPISASGLVELMALPRERLVETARVLKRYRRLIHAEDIKRAVRELQAGPKERVLVIPPEVRLGSALRLGWLRGSIIGSVPVAAAKEKKSCTVFGMIRSGIESLEIEDESGSLVLGEVKGPCFLAAGVCLGLKGQLVGGKFQVEKVVWPSLGKAPEVAGAALVFAGVQPTSSEAVQIKSVLQGFSQAEIVIEVVIIMTLSEPGNALARVQSHIGKEYPSVEFIVVPSKSVVYPDLNTGRRGNVTETSNPVAIKIGEGTLLVGAFELIDGLRGQCTVQGEYRAELARVMLSNRSYNPFVTYADLSYADPYAGMVIGDRHGSFVHNEEGKSFGMCGPFTQDNGQFLFYNPEKQEFEICALNQDSTEPSQEQ